ncbi:MAG: SBBP repeat-containing protein [Planctomycetes bacterium]|nr:SBBP repeat-containing protein [Planctomycetota bacterium]
MQPLAAALAPALLLATAQVAFAQGIPLVFEPNVGQSAADCEFLARAAGTTLHFRGATAEIRRPCGTSSVTVVGAVPTVRLTIDERAPGHSNYLIGSDPARWRQRVPQARSLRAVDVTPGIDLRWHGASGVLEYDFVLAPHADPAAIELRASERVRIDDQGRLLQDAVPDPIVHEAPVAWQEHDGSRHPVEVAFRLVADDRFGFTVGAHDPELPLVIDPVLTFGTYVGGADVDMVSDCTFDAAGNAVICGLTGSVDFPTAGASQGTLAGGLDAFAAKIDASGNLVWSTFFGGSGSDACWFHGLALDLDGRIYLAGDTSSPDFPLQDAIQTVFAGVYDGFLVRLTASGQLDYATYFGGANQEGFRAVAVHRDPNLGDIAYLTGFAYAGFPTTPTAFMPSNPGPHGNAILTCIAPRCPLGIDLLYSSYLGGGNSDRGLAIAVDPAGRAHLAGQTTQMAGVARFPTTASAFHTGATTNRKSSIIYTNYYACLDPFAAGAQLVYSVILENANDLGGSANGVALDLRPGGHVHALVCGGTADRSYPTTADAYRTTHSGYSDVFVTVIDPDLSGPASLIYSTLLGGTGSEGADDVGLANGLIHLAGVSQESGGKRPVLFPTTSDAIQPSSAGGEDAFVVILDRTASGAQQLVYSTLLGGSGADHAYCVAVAASGAICTGGMTSSTDLLVNRPTGFDATFGGDVYDGWLFRLD